MTSVRNAVIALSVLLATPLSTACGQQRSQSVAINNRQRLPLGTSEQYRLGGAG